MNLSAVLILGSNASKEISDIAFEAGHTPVIRESMGSVLQDLRTDKFAAIAVDIQHTSADLLEFILNVRDINEKIRVFVVSKMPKQIASRIPQAFPNVFFATTKELGHKLKPSLLPFRGAWNTGNMSGEMKQQGTTSHDSNGFSHGGGQLGKSQMPQNRL